MERAESRGGLRFLVVLGGGVVNLGSMLWSTEDLIGFGTNWIPNDSSIKTFFLGLEPYEN